jgi:hypothetical protein
MSSPALDNADTFLRFRKPRPMLPVTTEYLLADLPSRDFARTLGYLSVGVLVGCAVAMIIGFLVVTAH